MTSRQLRLVRGAAASTAATILAAVSHTIGGGAAPHPLLIAALSVFLTPVAAFLVGRRLNLARLSLTVLVSQSIFHVLFVALNATVTPAVTESSHHHALILTPLDAAPAAAPDLAMLGAHAAAAVLTTALLWRGESMLRTVSSWVRAALTSRLRMPQLTWAVPVSVARTRRSPTTTVWAGNVSRRGPPALSRG